MFNQVVVGVDGRSGGRDAIALARQLAATPTGLVLVRVDTGTDGSAGRALRLRAEREWADLLVVGSSRRGGVGRVLLGDNTLAALDGARCAVAIAPRGYASTRPRWATIGVGHDGSAESDLALAAARELALRRHAAIRVRAVVGLQGVPAGSAEPLDWTVPTQRAIRAERARLASIVGAQTEVVYGEAAQELEHLADDVQLLVVGSRGHGPLGRLLKGSVSTYLARHCRCPLLVMPRHLTRPAPGAPDRPSPDPPVPATRTS